MTDKKSLATIDDYLAPYPRDVQEVVQKIRAMMKATIPEPGEKISYQMPCFTMNGKNLIYIAAWKDYIGVYPIYDDEGLSAEDLMKYKRRKNSLHLPLTEPFAFDVIESVVRAKISATKL